MTNSATLINKVPVVFDSIPNFAGTNFGIKQILCAFDTINTDLEAYAPQGDGIPVILGWQHCGGADHNVKVSAADVTTLASPAELITYEFKAGSGISKTINGDPLLVGKPGKSLAIQVSVQPVKILLYVAEVKVLRV